MLAFETLKVVGVTAPEEPSCMCMWRSFHQQRVPLVAGTEKSEVIFASPTVTIYVESSEDKYKYKAELMLGCAEGHGINISTKSDQ
jgi:hypothetical protein